MTKPTSTVIVGLQWGDEGKGKISYLLSRGAKFSVRFQGGANAGHTVVTGQHRLKFNMLPAGSAAGSTPCIAAGCVVDLERIVAELETLGSLGHEKRLMISGAANVALELHKKMDSSIEESRGTRRVGTTRRGIGPAYADKALRVGVRVEDLFNDSLSEKLETLGALHGVKVDEPPTLRNLADSLRPYVSDVASCLNEALDRGEKIVFEGAQGTLLDIDHGTYPFVTSSNTTAGAACACSGVGPSRVGEVVGVAKAYTTRVGEGVFPTEIEGELADRLRSAGAEYGTTTGRPRRVGWLDIPALRYAAMLSNVNWIALTKLDVLAGLDKVKVCVSYLLDGKEVKTFSPSVRTLTESRPIYVEHDGWPRLTEAEWAKIVSGGWDSLPKGVRDYVDNVECLVGRPVRLISVGERVGMEVWR